MSVLPALFLYDLSSINFDFYNAGKNDISPFHIKIYFTRVVSLLTDGYNIALLK